MSIKPNGFSIRNSLWRRSASHAPPVYRPTIPVFGPTSGFSTRASSWQRFSASGSLVKVLLQDQLRRDGIDRFPLHAAQPPLRLDRGEALVDARHRQVEAPFELAREALDALRQRMSALVGDRQADHEMRRAPLRNQGLDLLEARDRRKRMSRSQFRLPDCNSDTLETEVEGENSALVRHALPNPAGARSRRRAAPSPRAAAPRPAYRR